MTDRAPFVRLAGRTGTPTDGTIWTVADGRRGRRCRAVTIAAGAVVMTSLVELSVAWRPTRIEVATEAGLLTLHPDPEGSSLHGNVARAQGVDHHAMPWSDVHWFDHPSLFLGLEPAMGPGETRDIALLRIDPALRPAIAAARVRRLADREWQLTRSDDGSIEVVTLDPDGLPIDRSGESWPLET